MFNTTQPLGRLARWSLEAIPKSSILPILSGPNRGLRWIVGAGQHSCWLGFYEKSFVDQVAAQIAPGMTVFDVGAHSGYYTLMLSRRVGPRGKVFAFEPNEINLLNLKKHLHLNRVRNVEIVEAAVTDRVGTACFYEEDYNSRLSDQGRLVKTVRLDDFPTPDFVKMDIEGAEQKALLGANRIVRGQATVWFIAIHGDHARIECPNLLSQEHYEITWASPGEFWAKPKRRR
jgi:FkbM family methyltransferase